MSWNELSLKDKADYIKESVNNGIYNLSDIRNRYNMYANGGYKPSESIKKRITNWEGSSMRTNRSFQAEANDFNRVIPSSIRSKLSQQQLDALYSYGYNVGMGKLKKRVLPTLTNYVQGKASNEDVQKSMWASKDNELRGLTTRRNIERSLFGGKYQTVFTGTGGTPHNYGYTTTTNRSSSNPYQIQNEEWQGKNYLGAYKGLQLSMNDIMGKTKETDINDIFSTGIGPTISMDNLLSIGNNTVAPVQPDYSYAKSLLSDFDSDLNSNIFAEGGNMDNNRTAMPAHPATNPYKRRSWETDEEYKERIQDLDNKSQEAALNDSTATNKYKEWKANIQKQQKINEEKSKAITIEKNTKRAETLEKEFNSLRNIPSQMSPNDTIQAINKNIPEAYKQQYINNINMYKPALDTIDLGINLYSLYNPTVPVLSAGLLTNGLQFGQSIVDEDLGATDYSALAFDTLGLLGATNKLPTRLRIGKNRFWDIDKTADYLGVGQNILDSAGDVYDLSKTGYHLYNNKGSNNLYISPFKKSFDEGGNLNFIDADNRRSNILLHTEDGNLYDSAGNNYTQSYLDEEHVPIIKGTMPRNTRQYYDPNTTLEFINAATAPISNFSPSNIVGSIREARDYNTFMNSFMNQDNTGFFTRKYAKEHPYISNAGNFLGDLALFSFPYNKASKINNIESLGKTVKSLTPSNKLETIDTALATGIGTIPGDMLVADSYNRTKGGKEATLTDNLEFYGGMGLSALGAVLGHDFSVGAFNLGKSAIGRTAYDVLFKPTQTLQAAKNGLYHINKEITTNKVGQAFMDGVYSGFDDYYKNYANPIQQYFIEGNSPSIKINTRNPNDRKIIVRLHPGEDELNEYAHFSNKFISPSGLDEYVTFATKSPTTNLPMMPSLKYYKGTGAHESLHGQLYNTIGPNPLSKYDVESKYFRGNPDTGIDFSSWENEASTNWSKSIEELEAEFFNYKAKNNLEGKFKDLTKTQQQEFIDLASKRFRVSKNGIRNGMSTLNKYFDTVMPKVK